MKIRYVKQEFHGILISPLKVKGSAIFFIYKEIKLYFQLTICQNDLNKVNYE
jgi:hypothetical protein